VPAGQPHPLAPMGGSPTRGSRVLVRPVVRRQLSSGFPRVQDHRRQRNTAVAASNSHTATLMSSHRPQTTTIPHYHRLVELHLSHPQRPCDHLNRMARHFRGKVTAPAPPRIHPRLPESPPDTRQITSSRLLSFRPIVSLPNPSTHTSTTILA